MTPTPLILDAHDTTLGTILTVFDQGILCALDFREYEDRLMGLLNKRYPAFTLAQATDPCGFRAVIDRYLAGDLTAFNDIEVTAKGTAFQQDVWRALRTIPAGETTSYGALARKINRPKAVRALGRANALNPIALVVPCHRVIGHDGALTGYAGGLDRKAWLLRHEGAL